ncbi:MAG: cytochrome P450 [Gammaproteobacteria bacterium]
MSSQQNPQLLPPGPAERFDINVDDESFHKLAQWVARYGGIIKVEPATRRVPSYVLNSPEYVKHVLITNHRNYTKGVGFERVKMLLGNGIIVSDGDFWRSQRRMIQPAFHRQVITRLAQMMQACNQRKLEDWSEKAARRHTINITHEMSELALEVVLRALFSVDLDMLIAAEGENPFAILVQDFTRDLQLAMKFRGLTRHVADMMSRRRADERTEFDFLSMLMDTRDKETDEPMTDKALIDEVMTIIVAGHETTAGTLNWIWYLLSQHPNVETKLQAEADTFESAPGFADLEHLPYARQVAEEALRLYPPVWLFSRKAVDADSVGGFYIPPGTDIFLCPYLLHRDAEHWDNPDAFTPERFASNDIKERNRYTYFPFSMGSRRCIGEFFSMVDMQLHLGLLAKHFRLKHVPDKPIELEPHINLRTRHSIMMLPEARKR